MNSTLKSVLFLSSIGLAAFLTMAFLTGDEQVEQAKQSKANLFQGYQQWSHAKIDSLPPEDIKRRKELLSEMQNTSTYKALVGDELVLPEYLPTLTLISHGIQSTYVSEDGEEAFGLNREMYDRVQNQPKGSDKLKFTANVLTLSLDNRGGIPVEVLDVVERYRQKFGMYGEPHAVLGNGEYEHISHPYHLTFIYALVRLDNEALEAISHTVKDNWKSKNFDEPLVYPFMAIESSYNQMVQQHNQNSNSDQDVKTRKEKMANANNEKFEEQCISSWSGACPNLERLVKKHMHDPSSYDHEKTVYWNKGDYALVQMSFRAKNGFGAVVIQSITAKVNWDCEVIEVVE